MGINDKEDKIDGYTEYDVATYYNIDVEEVRNICSEFGVGMETEDGSIWFTKGKKDCDSDISVFRLFYKNRNIEKKVIETIEKNQGISIRGLSKKVGLKREPLIKVLDEITFKDGKLYERKVDGDWKLFYRELS